MKYFFLLLLFGYLNSSRCLSEGIIPQDPSEMADTVLSFSVNNDVPYYLWKKKGKVFFSKGSGKKRRVKMGEVNFESSIKDMLNNYAYEEYQCDPLVRICRSYVVKLVVGGKQLKSIRFNEPPNWEDNESIKNIIRLFYTIEIFLKD